MKDLSRQWVEVIVTTPYPEGSTEEQLIVEEECRLRILDRAKDLGLI